MREAIFEERVSRTFIIVLPRAVTEDLKKDFVTGRRLFRVGEYWRRE